MPVRAGRALSSYQIFVARPASCEYTGISHDEHGMPAARMAGMKRIIELGFVTGSLLAGGFGLVGCVASADDADADIEDPASAALDPAKVVTTDDTSDTSARPTGAQAMSPPQIAYSGDSRVSLLAGLSTGSSVQITGDPSDDAFALARYSVAVSGNRATARFTVDPAPGASFIYNLNGSGSGYSTRNLRLERIPGSNQLQATTATGPVACGPIANAATSVTLVYDGDRHTFDVKIGGAPSACTGLTTRMKPPAIGFELMDAPTAGYGGEVTFSQLALF